LLCGQNGNMSATALISSALGAQRQNGCESMHTPLASCRRLATTSADLSTAFLPPDAGSAQHEVLLVSLKGLLQWVCLCATTLLGQHTSASSPHRPCHR
jgi:hypothetical protein